MIIIILTVLDFNIATMFSVFKLVLWPREKWK